MNTAGDDGQDVVIDNGTGTPVTCGECHYGIFMVDLFLPGGLRFTCRGCDEPYSPKQLAALGKKQRES